MTPDSRPLTVDEVQAMLPDPDLVGTTGYRAVYEAIDDALVDLPNVDDPLRMAISQAESVREEVDGVLRILRGDEDRVKPAIRIAKDADLDGFCTMLSRLTDMCVRIETDNQETVEIRLANVYLWNGEGCADGFLFDGTDWTQRLDRTLIDETTVVTYL